MTSLLQPPFHINVMEMKTGSQDVASAHHCAISTTTMVLILLPLVVRYDAVAID